MFFQGLFSDSTYPVLVDFLKALRGMLIYLARRVFTLGYWVAAEIFLDPMEPVFRSYALGSQDFTTPQPSIQAFSSCNFRRNSELIEQSFKIINALSDWIFLALLKAI